MPYETTRYPKASTVKQDKRVLELLRLGHAPKDVVRKTGLTVTQVKEAVRRRKLFYARRRR
jgi:hypothetical protein